MIRQSDTRVRVSMPSVRRSHKSTGRILRSMLCLALIACTVLGCLPERMAQAADDGRINASGVNIRTGAGTDYAVVGCLNYKDEIEVLGSSGNWYKVKVLKTGEVGWVSKTYTTKVKPSGGSTATVATRYDPLNVRTGPGTGYTVVGSVKKGRKVTVKSISGDWAYITYGSLKGWSYLHYLKF